MKHRFLKVLKLVGIILLAGFIVLVGFRTKHIFDVEKTNAQIEKIHNTKLQMSDVMGDNLPPDPGTTADATIEGVDANINGIRDDVELAVFKEYPNSAKTRAVLLQYALALQTQMTLPLINKDIMTIINEEDSRSYDCIGKIVPIGDNDLEIIKKYRIFIEKKQINTKERVTKKESLSNYEGSFELKSGCDIDSNKLPN